MADNSIEFIVETPQISKSIALLNRIEDLAKLRLLLQRIIQKLHLTNEQYFKEEELTKLESSFEIKSEELASIIDIIEFIYLQSAYTLIKTNVLHQELQRLNLNNDTSILFCEIWKDNYKEIVEKFRETRTISYKKLVDIKWKLQIQLASDAKSRQKSTNALIEFNVSNNSDKTKDNFLVEFTKDELYDFYLKLETIQKQIDNLNA